MQRCNNGCLDELMVHRINNGHPVFKNKYINITIHSTSKEFKMLILILAVSACEVSLMYSYEFTCNFVFGLSVREINLITGM